MNDQNIIVEVANLSKSYKSRGGTIAALQDFNLCVEKGEILGLLGPNGAGKTTAVKLIMGFIAPTHGEMFFQGQMLSMGDPRRQIGYLPESFLPNPNLSVYEYLKFQCELATAKKHALTRSQIMELLQLVGMDKFHTFRISELSKGMGQRVGLAQAFAGSPDFLILDEPTTGLDPVGKSEIIEVLLALKKRGKTIFFCSHILSEVERLCDRIGILVAGQLRFLGTVGEFLQKWEVQDLEQGFKMEAQCTAS